MILILTGAVIFDLFTDKIPNRYLLSGFLFLLIQRLTEGGISGIGRTIISLFFILCISLPFFALGTVGGGDIKCLCLAGLFFPVSRMVIILCLALLVGAAEGIVKLIRYRSCGGGFRYLIRFLLKTVREIRMHGVTAVDESYIVGMGTEEVRERGIHFSLPILISVLMAVWGIV